MTVLVGVMLNSSTPCVALTSGQAYFKALTFLRAQGVVGWEATEAQPVLLGEALAADPRAAGPRSATWLASLELASVDARARRMRALAPLGLDVLADQLAVLAARNGSSALGASFDYLPTPLDAVAYPTLTSNANNAATVLVGLQLTSGADAGMWPLVRKGTAGDLATTVQALLALAPRQAVPAYQGAFDTAVSKLASLGTTRAYVRALKLLGLLAKSPPPAGTSGVVGNLVALQGSNGSFGTEPVLQDRVYATALAALALERSDASFPFDSDGDGVVDETDKDDDGDGFCDPGQGPPGCTGTDAFPNDATEWADLDLDGIGNAADLDDDGDGVPDAQEPGFATNPQERVDTDGDALADTADPDDDDDGLDDVAELLAGLDPRDVDTDGDWFRDATELAEGTDARNASQYPLPDGDVFPLGAPDGMVDGRDALLATQVLRGDVTVPSSAQTAFLRHADVAPLVVDRPSPNGSFDGGDALVLVRRVHGLVAEW